MAFKLLDRARMSVSGAPGTGQITLASAVTGYQSFTQAGISNGDSFPYSLIDGNNWEYGVATYVSAGTKLTRTVGKTSAQNTTPLNLSNRTVVSACLRAEDISGVATLAGLTDVTVSPGPATDGWALTWKNADLKFELAQITYASLPDKPTIPINSGFNLQSLGDTAMTPGPATNGYIITWNSATSKFVLSPSTSGAALTALSDVTITSPTNGQALIYDSGTSKWKNSTVSGGSVATLTDVTLTSLTTNQILRWNGTAWVNIAIPAQALVGLSDVQITTGAGVNGYSVTWNNGLGKFVLTNITGGGGGGTGPGGTMTPPTAAALAVVTNLNSAVLTSRTTGVLIPNLHIKPDVSAANSTLYCALQAAPVGNFSLVVKVRNSSWSISGGWYGAGPVIHNSAGTLSIYMMKLTTSWAVYTTKWTGGFSSNTFAGGQTFSDEDFFQHIDYNGTNYSFGVSRNGKDVVWFFSEPVATFIGAITHVGIGWSGAYAATTGPEWDYQHYYAGAQGNNGL